MRKHQIESLLCKIFIAQLLLLSHLKVKGQDIFNPPTDSARLKIEAKRINAPIVLDGKLDEEVWQSAQEVGNFLETWPSQLKQAVHDTKVKVLYDDKNIYVGATCYNPNGRRGLHVQDMRRDFGYSNSESFAVTLDPFQDMRNPIPTFLVTPFGTQLDQLSYDDRIVDTDWDGVWKVRCSILDSAWVAEIQIPFSSIRYPSGAKQWRINFSRLIRNKSQIVGWSPWPLAFTFGRTTYAGHLNNVSAPANNLNIRLLPYALLKGASINESRIDYSPSAGGELKWGITPNTILEGTVNTDFAQADVDRQVINLNRSSVFFPERRQFFLENANLFSVGLDGVLQPFFSRSIGRNEFGFPLKIKEGLRFIHQNSKKAIGGLFINQQGDTTTGGSRIGLARAQFNLKNNSRIATMGILRYDEEFKTTPSNYNSVGIIDGFWRANKLLYVRPMLSLSHDSQSGKTGYAGLCEINFTKNKIFASVTEAVVTSGYNSSTGFVARKDFFNTSPALILTLWGKWLPRYLIYYRPNFVADIYHTTSTGKFQEATLSISPLSLVFRGYHRAALTIVPAWQQLTTTFGPVPGAQILARSYYYMRYQLSYDGNLSAPYSLSFNVSKGGYYNGKLNSYFVSLRVAPIPHVSCVLSYTRNDFIKIGETENSFTKELIAPEIRLAMNANVLLSGFYQYNTATGTGALNVRFSWQYKPLSFIYFVYNDLRSLPSIESITRFQQQTGIIKVSYIKQL